MIDPLASLFGGISKWLAGGVAGGAVYSAMVLEANPQSISTMTPDLNTSIIGLVVAVVGYVFKSYVPSEKQVNANFEVLKEGHKSLQERLMEFATASRETDRETHEFRQDMRGWLGKIEGSLDAAHSRLDRMDARMEGIECAARKPS